MRDQITLSGISQVTHFTVTLRSKYYPFPASPIHSITKKAVAQRGDTAPSQQSQDSQWSLSFFKTMFFPTFPMAPQSCPESRSLRTQFSATLDLFLIFLYLGLGIIWAQKCQNRTPWAEVPILESWSLNLLNWNLCLFESYLIFTFQP